MPKVTVLMPSLNVAKYIRECIESVVNQTLQDIEILCIDAGSTDGTWEILKEYAQQDKRIRLIHSDQKSYGYQMNLGIREATGEYIGVVETDDFIRPQMYETLYHVAKEQDADFVKSDFDAFVTQGDGQRLFLNYSLQRWCGLQYQRLYSSRDYIRNKSTVDIFIWNGIYRRDFLIANDIRLQETPGAAFQDCGFRYQVALFVNRGYFLQQSFYCYRRDNVGSSTYNNKTVLYNLSECKYLLSIIEKREIKDPLTWAFLAREMFVIAYRPHVELLCWQEPDEGTEAALEEFRRLFRGLEEKGLISQRSMERNEWLNFQIFIGDQNFYDYYAHLQARLMADEIRNFVSNMREAKQIILFGSGVLGKRAYCLLRVNQVDSIVAFADNAKEKWGTEVMGCPVDDPEKLIHQYSDGYFLIANAAHREEIQDQLLGYGIPPQQIGAYELERSPIECTNIYMD